MNPELTAGTGLIARWGMNEGTGTTYRQLGRQRRTARWSAARAGSPGAPFDVGDRARRARRTWLRPTARPASPVRRRWTSRCPTRTARTSTSRSRRRRPRAAGPGLHDRRDPGHAALLATPIARRRSTTRRRSGSSTPQADLNTVFVTHLGDIVEHIGTSRPSGSAPTAVPGHPGQRRDPEQRARPATTTSNTATRQSRPSTTSTSRRPGTRATRGTAATSASRRRDRRRHEPPEQGQLRAVLRRRHGLPRSSTSRRHAGIRGARGPNGSSTPTRTGRSSSARTRS